MAALSQSTRRKLSLLQLAEELHNVSRACRIMGYHRDTFYKIRRGLPGGGATPVELPLQAYEGFADPPVIPEVRRQVPAVVNPVEIALS